MPVDRTIFLGLIVCGLMVIVQRRTSWSDIFRENKWIWIFYLYLGASVLWSDYPFVSFKRWTKELGMVIMILVVLTDRDPAAAVRTLFARCAYLLIPLSVVLIKYYPELGRSYDRWTGEASFSGVTTNKNLLGMVLFATALSLTWMWTHRHTLRPHSTSRATWIPFVVLTPMLVWLFQQANSATALVCAVIGVMILIAMQLPFIRVRSTSLAGYVIACLLAIALLQSVFDLRSLAVGILGRDVTLTGRTDIWERVLAEPINPLLGTGFYSFWLGDRNEKISADFDYLLGTAHNSYIEVYLNSGVIGLGLLLCTMAHAFNRSKQMVARELVLGDLWLTFLLVASIYAMTEAVFNRLSLVWFLVLLAMVSPPALASSEELDDEPSSEDSPGPQEHCGVPNLHFCQGSPQHVPDANFCWRTDRGSRTEYAFQPCEPQEPRFRSAPGRHSPVLPF